MPTAGPKPRRADYSAYKERQAAISRRRSAEGREVGPLPKVGRPRRKAGCRRSLRRFCETYLADTFRLAWSADHRKVLAKLEACVLRGGLFALAMPRGSGKTSLSLAAAVWALLYGHRRFVVLVGATGEAATELLAEVMVLLESNDRLLEDFPEVCHPIRSLEGIANRANGQTVGGRRTRIGWTQTEVVLPTVKGSRAAGGRLRVAGITGRVRGMRATLADGTTVRPDLCIADDPQTDESAASRTQTDARERVLLGAVRGLAGPGQTIALFVPCTVIQPDDLSDRLLDPERHPEFQGERCKTVYAFPAAADLWDRYAELRRESFRAGGRGEEATDFYRNNRAAMDAGGVVAWAERFDPAGELSAMQAAMNRKIDAPAAFAAEDQNEPLRADAGAGHKRLPPAATAARLSGVPRGVVPAEAGRLTGFVDVGGELLWWCVCGWDDRFGGQVVDYGCWPEQPRPYFAAAAAPRRLSDLHPGFSEEQRVYAGLAALLPALLAVDRWRRPDGTPVPPARLLVDSGDNTGVVLKALRSLPQYAAVLSPSKGVGRSATQVGVGRWKVRPGELAGEHWRKAAGGPVLFDPDAWKTFAWHRLTTPPGGAGAVTLFGPPADHALFADHLAAESAEPKETKGDRYDHWQERPDRPDNHWWDCLVGCHLAAGVDGLRWDALVAGPQPPAGPRPRRSMADLQRQARSRRSAHV